VQFVSRAGNVLQNFADALYTVLKTKCNRSIAQSRLKTDIQPFPAALYKLVQLRPVHFRWKSTNPPEHRFGTGSYSGLIAQEVELVLPEMVTTDDAGYRRVNYSELRYLLLQGVRELKTRNDTLTFEVQAQRRQIEQAHSEIAKLAHAGAAKGARFGALNKQYRNLTAEGERLKKVETEMTTLEARLARLETQEKATRTAHVRRNPRSGKPARTEIARVGF